ncbi:MAG: septum formation initiator family protein [Flavobacteriales bacterium]|nr:septum formation initiator family protein [Flavobacteriales bacterium]
MFSIAFKYIKNKYILSGLIFFIWILFFDQNNLVTQFSYRNELNKLLEDKQYYTQEIKQTLVNLNELTSNPKTLEKFARENYLMKKDDEDVFIIVEEK